MKLPLIKNHASLKHPKLPIIIRMPVIIWQIVYVYITDITKYRVVIW